MGQMIQIPAGPFISGLTPEQQQELADQYGINVDLFQNLSFEQIDLPAYYIDKFLVTNQQYKALY